MRAHAGQVEAAWLVEGSVAEGRRSPLPRPRVTAPDQLGSRSPRLRPVAAPLRRIEAVRFDSRSALSTEPRILSLRASPRGPVPWAWRTGRYPSAGDVARAASIAPCNSASRGSSGHDRREGPGLSRRARTAAEGPREPGDPRLPSRSVCTVQLRGEASIAVRTRTSRTVRGSGARWDLENRAIQGRRREAFCTVQLRGEASIAVRTRTSRTVRGDRVCDGTSRTGRPAGFSVERCSFSCPPAPPYARCRPRIEPPRLHERSLSRTSDI